MPKENLKDKLDGNELDLSLSNMAIVPVKEIAAIPKATHLDLSCNQITSLPDNFCTLKNLVKLDLSKNSLTCLPPDIGSLAKLQYLDLFNNQLHMLPVSFWQLKSLKWLDLKDNPLDETLKSIAGDCLDDNQCKKCAKQVLLYMKTLESEQERQRQRQLQLEREKEVARKVEEEKEKQKRKAEKLAEKERRRKEYHAAQQRKQEEGSSSESKEESKVQSNGLESSTVGQSKENQNVGLSCWGVLITALIGLVAVLVGLYFYCDSHLSDPMCSQGKAHLTHYYQTAQQLVRKYTQS